MTTKTRPLSIPLAALTAALSACATVAPPPAAPPAPAPVADCPGRPDWACMAETAPCTRPEYAGKICALGIAAGLSESLGVSTASTAAKGSIAKYLEARVEAFNKRVAGARTSGDTTEEVQKVQDKVQQYSQQTLVGVLTPRRFFDPATRTTYVLAVVDEVSFKKWVAGMKEMATLSEATRQRIDETAAEVDAAADAARAEKVAADAARAQR